MTKKEKAPFPFLDAFVFPDAAHLCTTSLNQFACIIIKMFIFCQAFFLFCPLPFPTNPRKGNSMSAVFRPGKEQNNSQGEHFFLF